MGHTYTKLDESHLQKRKGMYIYEVNAKQHRDVIQNKYIRDREKKHLLCMKDAESAVNKFRQAA